MQTSFAEESQQWRWRKESRFERCLEVGQKIIVVQLGRVPEGEEPQGTPGAWFEQLSGLSAIYQHGEDGDSANTRVCHKTSGIKIMI